MHDGGGRVAVPLPRSMQAAAWTLSCQDALSSSPHVSLGMLGPGCVSSMHEILGPDLEPGH